MDDYAGDATTTGFFSLRDNYDSPLLATHETGTDSDWFLIDQFERYFDYQVSIFRSDPNQGLEQKHLRFFDLDSDRIWTSNYFSIGRSRSYKHWDSSGQYFLAVNARGAGEYRVYLRHSDIGGDTFGDATPMELNTRPFYASAIESLGDVDWYSFQLRAGTEYTVNLLGESSFDLWQTTLNNPLLRVFDSNGSIVAKDNNSGDGKNAQVRFTPEATGLYYFQVLEVNGTKGSYILQSNQFDDFAGDPSTTGVLIAGADPIMGRGDFGNDRDWFQAEFQDFYKYRVSSDRFFQLYDSNSDWLKRSEDDRNGGEELFYKKKKDQGSAFFVGVNAADDYQVRIEIVDDFGSYINSFGKFNLANPFVAGAIEQPGDRDWFQTELVQFGKYLFSVEGLGADAVDQPALAIRDWQGSLLLNGGVKPFVFSVPDSPSYLRRVFVDVRSNDLLATGVYRLNVTPIDLAAGDTSTKWNVQMVNGIGRIQNALEITNDIDYHRIEMKADTWYRLTRDWDNHFKIVSPSGHEFRSHNQQNPAYYYANQSGEYYIVVDSVLASGGYTVKIREGAAPPIRSAQFSWPNSPPNDRMDAFTRFSGPSVEVYSDVELKYQSGSTQKLIAPNQLATLTLEQWKTAVPSDNLQRSGNAWVRNQRGSGYWSGWSNFQIDAQPFPEVIATDAPEYLIRQYAFADGLPSYLAGDPRFPNSQPLTEDERIAMRGIFTEWSRNNFSSRFSEVATNATNDIAATMIFKADLNSDVLAFASGPNEGGDIILNTSSPLWNDLSQGAQGLFEFARAIGTILGLKQTAELGRDQSVMGLRSGGPFDDLPFASTPLPRDLFGVRRETDRQLHRGGNPGDSTYWLGGPDEFFRTIVDGTIRENNTITANGSNHDSRIDLLPGGRSHSTDANGHRPYTFLNSYFSSLHTGIGGNGDDALIGNHFDNRLDGRSGNDVLIGGIGNDLLLGGGGDDFYLYRFGHGNDLITEKTSGGGNDVVRIEGMHNLTSLADDVTFQRLGEDLVIRLEMDGMQDRDNQSIRIKHMSDPNARVESLSLHNLDGFISKVSLVSAFEQATEVRGRFTLAPESDAYGRLVVPV